MRTAIYLVPDGGSLWRRLHRRRLRACAAGAKRRAPGTAAFTLCTSAILQHDLLLLRLQQDRYPRPWALGEIYPLPWPRDRHRLRTDRSCASSSAAALGRWHADIPRARGVGAADANAAQRLCDRTRR